MKNTSDLTRLATNMTSTSRFNSELSYYNPSFSSYYEIYRLRGSIIVENLNFYKIFIGT